MSEETSEETTETAQESKNIESENKNAPTSSLSDEDKEKRAKVLAYMRDYGTQIEYAELEEKIKNNFEFKIKFDKKKTIVIGNPEGLDIVNIIKKSGGNIDLDNDNIIVLGNITDSTFSKNPILEKEIGEDDQTKLQSYYKRIIENKSFNSANTEFCTKDNVLFIFGNREIDKIKIKQLVELESDNYNSIDEYIEKKNKDKYNFKIKNINSFYPFWVKYYFTDPYKIPTDYKFLRRFKKIFKAIDAEMLLFTIYYELNEKNAEILDELSKLAISYFYQITELVKPGKVKKPTELTGDDPTRKFINLETLEKLDYLAYFLFKYFYEQLSKEGNLYNLLLKGEFVFTLKVNDKYYIFSHGGIPRIMAKKISVEKLELFTNKNTKILTDDTKIIKMNPSEIIALHNKAKEEQTKYFDTLYDKNATCDTKTDVIINFGQSNSNIDINIDINEYNMLLYHSINKDFKAINKIIKPSKPQVGGYISTKRADKFLGYETYNFYDKPQEELSKYNDYLKQKVNKLLTETVVSTDDTPNNDLILLLCLAHQFNSDMFKNINTGSLQVSEKIKSKDYSVLINTIFDHRKSNNVLYTNVNQIIANSNNTAQTTEATYDSIFYGTIIDCYELHGNLLGIPKKLNYKRNLIISVDNSSLIKIHSFFDSLTCLLIEPDLKENFYGKYIAIKTIIENSTGKYEIFNTLQNAYKVLLNKIGRTTYGKKEIRQTILPSNYVCPNMNFYGIANNEIIFSKSKVDVIKFHGYNFNPNS
jgi:hypothetical protein